MTIDKARISLRISTHLWEHPDRWRETFQFVSDYASTLDEVAFFTSPTHPPLPLEVVRSRAVVLADLICEVNSLGIPAGINHLSTIGHLDEYAEYSLNEPWQKFVDISGAEGKLCYCPQDPSMRRYIADSYIALAQANPAFIWIDDDVRLGGHAPVGTGCFCDRCIARFSAGTGRDWTRASLRAAFGSDADKLAVRSQWLAHNRAVMCDIFTDIRAAVDEVDPAMQLGWMSCDLVYEGFDYDNWYTAIEGPNRIPAKARPGGGFYTDYTPTDVLWKAHSIGWQNSLLPESVTDIQSEHENFPYQALRKSIQMFGAEIGVYGATGCTGTALNLMGMTPDPIDEFRPYMDRVRDWRAFFDAESAAFGRSHCEGLWAAHSKELHVAKGLDGDWFDMPFAPGTHGPFREICEIGLPCAYNRSGSAVTLFGGDSVLAFTKAELEEILSGGVFMDGRSVQRLHELGLGDLVGYRVTGAKDFDTVEEFTEDPINGRFTGWRRDTRPSFWKTMTELFEPTDSAARVLSKVVDIYGKPAGIASGVYENALGGRVAVAGYAPWTMMHTLAKATQLKTLNRWLSSDTLPAYVESYHRITLWCRRGPGGKLALFAINTSLDTASGAIVAVREDSPTRAIRPGKDWEAVRATGSDGVYTTIELPELGPWEMAVIA